MSRIPYQLDIYEGTNSADVGKELGRFVVLYGKTSNRKHKVWEGDGILICYSDCCVLKSDDEKNVICKSTAVKVDEIEDGRILVLGTWSVEIQERIERKITDLKIPGTEKEIKKTDSPRVRDLLENRKRGLNIPNTQVSTKRAFISPMLNSNGELNEKVAPMVLSDGNGPLVSVDPRFVRALRTHQKEGIQFMFDCIGNESGGAILADEMGLGKSIQTMAVTWALMRGSKTGQCRASSCLIMVPSSLVNNWKSEFAKWWRFMVFPAVIVRKIEDLDCFGNLRKSQPYLVISYDMAVRYSEKINNLRFDIIVCDEGHKLKNMDSKLRRTLSSLNIPKRLILTGTPLQNDYDEFYSLLDFIRPGEFGTLPEFVKMCSEEPKKLNEMIGNCMLRRTAEVNKSHLPTKYEYILFCEASKVQKAVHEEICDHMTGDPLSLIFFARQLVNHPKLLYDNLFEKHENGNRKHSSLLHAFPEKYVPRGGVEESGKLGALVDMLKSFRLVNECAVIVSNFIETLDMIEQLCVYLHFRIFRLDGRTNVQDRQKLVKQFNEVHDASNVFLLSTKAGGVGLNLIGASRLVLFDSDWNPANDQQAMARIWRDGQARVCHIYRLVTTGTIEEKMLQRQIKKTGLGCVIDAIEVGDTISTFTKEDLADIFTFSSDTECNTHDLCECQCDGSGMLETEMMDSDEDDMDDEELEEESPIENGDDLVPDSQIFLSNKGDKVFEKDEKETGRASLAELSRWRHFSPRHAETWKHFMVNAGLAQVNLSFAFYLDSQY